LISLAGCSRVGPILEAKDVQFFKVEENNSNGIQYLKLSGLAFNSSMSVEKITTLEKNGAVTVLVHLFPARAGKSGSFAYVMPIPPSANEVLFGMEGAQLWKRDSGIAPKWKKRE
jgi:hypothetical protein